MDFWSPVLGPLACSVRTKPGKGESHFQGFVWMSESVEILVKYHYDSIVISKLHDNILSASMYSCDGSLEKTSHKTLFAEGDSATLVSLCHLWDVCFGEDKTPWWFHYTEK